MVLTGDGEYQLTDALKLLMDKRKLYAITFDGDVYDIGSRLGLLKANIDFAVMRDVEIYTKLIDTMLPKTILCKHSSKQYLPQLPCLLWRRQ
ncbi:MAG: hypothetical protein J6Y29_04065 [Clostridiales bacterium]|nr:hypothetical protein [Clostridiales bacterium]